MSTTFNEKLIAYLALFSGLAISGVAEYYSIMGLIAIYPAAVWPIVIMGVVLGLGKITGTVWLKQNWSFAPFFLKVYILPAIIVLMMITSLGVFGFLSKAHSDQSLVSGDVQAKIAVYDEKIKTAKDNIDANRKALKQMDESVDQVMGRSQDEKGADKAVALRRGQAKERTRLLSEITAEQKVIAQLSEERAPIAAEVRKVEAEVGPIKYIAHLLYGENPDANVLEKSVIWVTILIVVVLDPLAVILLLASQYSFQRFREKETEIDWQARTDELLDTFDKAPDPYIADVGEKPTEEEKLEIAEGDSPEKESDVVSTATVTAPFVAQEVAEVIPEAFVQEPERTVASSSWAFTSPSTSQVEEVPAEPEELEEDKEPVRTVITGNRMAPRTMVFKKPPQTLTSVTEEIVQEQLKEDESHIITRMGNGYIQIDGQLYKENNIPPALQGYVQNEEQSQSSKWSSVKKNEE